MGGQASALSATMIAGSFRCAFGMHEASAIVGMTCLSCSRERSVQNPGPPKSYPVAAHLAYEDICPLQRQPEIVEYEVIVRAGGHHPVGPGNRQATGKADLEDMSDMQPIPIRGAVGIDAYRPDYRLAGEAASSWIFRSKARVSSSQSSTVPPGTWMPARACPGGRRPGVPGPRRESRGGYRPGPSS